MRRYWCGYLGSLLSLAVQQQAVGAVRGDDCAGKEQGRKEAGKGQAEAPPPQVVLNTCLQMQARLSPPGQARQALLGLPNLTLLPCRF